MIDVLRISRGSPRRTSGRLPGACEALTALFRHTRDPDHGDSETAAVWQVQQPPTGQRWLAVPPKRGSLPHAAFKSVRKLCFRHFLDRVRG
mgnify:CR=1 FL=1